MFSRNLLILQSVGEQDPSDWITIQRRIERNAPDIEVRIANNGHGNSVTARWQVRRPSLVFSPLVLINFEPRGGTVYSGRVIHKDEQLRRLSSAGIPTPRTETLSSASLINHKEWGDYLVVKPAQFSHSGKGVTLVRTMDLSTRYDELSALFDGPILVQPFIDHSEDGFPTEFRVLTMFGSALYCARNRWGVRRRPVAEIAADPLGVIASNNKQMGGRIRSVCNDAEIIALGERVHQAFPECALLGVDIIRESQTGQLYVLETNPYGMTWHFSSPLSKTFDPQHVRELYAQFNALDHVADLLIQKTRAEAC